MFKFLMKPVTWFARQTLGTKRGTEAVKRYEAQMEQLYKDLTPDEMEAALDSLTDAAGRILAAKKAR